MRLLAAHHTRAELERMLYGAQLDARRASGAHLRAVQRSTSMSSQSAARASTRNVVAATGDAAIALRGALEIYDLFPEHTREGA